MIYGTPQTLAAYIDPDAEAPTPPPLASVLLRHASALVERDATARYRTANGAPTDAAVLDALTRATLEQASAWALHGIDPRKGAAQLERGVKSKSLNGAAVTYDDALGQGDLIALASGDTLTGTAWGILDTAGLISNGVGVTGVETFNIAQRHYDPLSGQLTDPVI